MVEATDAIRRGAFVGQGITEKAPFPTEGRPLATDGAMHLVCPCAWCPVDGATLEMVEATDAIRCDTFIGDWITEKAPFPTEGRPFATDGAMHLVCPCAWAPIDRTKFIMSEGTDSVGGRRLRDHWLTKKTICTA